MLLGGPTHGYFPLLLFPCCLVCVTCSTLTFSPTFAGFIGSVLHCVQDPAVDIEVRRECTSMLASAVHGGSAFGATMLANAKTTTHLAALATGMLSLPGTRLLFPRS